MPRLPPLLSAALFVCGFLPPAVSPAAEARLQADRLEGPGWWAERVDVELAVDARARPRLRLTAAAASLPAGLGEVTGLEVTCARLRTSAGRWTCPQAVIHGKFRDWGPQQFTAQVDYRPRGTVLELRAEGLRFGGGRLSLAARLDGDRWRAQGQLAAANLRQLQQETSRWTTWPEGRWSGASDIRLEAGGRDTHIESLRATIEVPSLDYQGADGLTATEALAGTLDIGWQDPAQATRAPPAVSFRFAARDGQLYLDPVFVAAGTAPFVLEGSGHWRGDRRWLEDIDWAFRQPGVLAARGNATVNFGDGALLRSVVAELVEVEPARAWPVYVAPYLAATDFKELEVTGGLGGSLTVHEGALVAADLQLRRFSLTTPDATLAWQGLGGALRWTADDSPSPLESAAGITSLAWEGGRFYGLPFGAAAMQLQLAGRGARLLEPLAVPILDGSLRIDTLRVRHAGEPRMWLRLDAELLPIDMAQLSRAFGWPPFGGKLAGRIPKAALDDGVLTLGGNLEAEVFGGRVTLGGLQLQDPLGRFPQLQADITLSNLDLALLTGVFEFGHISGRLSGEVRDLQLFDWRPVAFDAWLATPPDDRSAHRITPRAVQNLSSLGGGSGVTSALSSGFLRFFKDFGYRRLGIACRLEQDVCRMGGVAPAPGGYYLIQGAGLPRINLIGSQGRVAWSKLLRQLQRLGEGAPLEVR